MGKSTVNINNTDAFSNVQNYLESAKTSLDSYKEELEGIGSNTSGELRTFYNNKAAPVKTKIESIKTKISSASSHISSALAVYYMTDEKLLSELNDVYDSIFNDEDYENKLLYVNSKDKEKLSYEEFIDLVNNSEAYFKEQREKVYNEFLNKMVTAGPALIKKLGTNVYNAIVENTYLCISDAKYGSNRYKKELQDFKNKFAREINKQYSNTDFVPKCYMENQNAYNRALLTLSFDTKDEFEMRDLLWDTFRKIDDRVAQNEYGISHGMDYLDAFYSAKDIITNVPQDATPKELLDYYTNEVNGIKQMFDLTNTNGYVITDATYYPDYDAWYDTIKNTKAFQKIKDLLPNDKYQIYDMTNKMDFLSAIYQYDGIEALQGVYYKYIGKCIGGDTPKEYITNGDLSRIILYSTENNILSSLYQPIVETKSNLATIDDSEKNALLLFAKDLDTSDITDEAYQAALKDYNGKWNGYCNGDYTKYLEDWELKAFAKILNNDKDLANKLFNNSEGADRGIFNDKIMEGYAFDVAKDRVKLMAMDNQDGIAADEYLRSILFSAAFGFGYGITDFTTGLVDVFAADGKMDRRQMEKNNIMMLLSSDYSLQKAYYDKDPKTMEMFASDYPEDYVKTIKLKNFTKDDIDELINDCRNNNVPRYELEYYMGNISYEDFIKYQSIANLSEEDLAFYASLSNNSTTKWLADKSFKVSNTVGTMAIPTVLSILAQATGPIGGLATSGLSTFVSTTATALSYTSLFASNLGRNRESLMQSGETNNAYILTNALLKAGFETFGEMALGRILKPTKVTEFLKETTARNHPILGAIFNASDNFEAYLLRNNCNPTLARYLSGIVGEVIEENTENIFGHGVDTATAALIKHEVSLPSLSELAQEAWETTWLTALTTPLLNGMTNLTLSNVTRSVDINGQSYNVSLSDLLRFTNDETNMLDYAALSRYLGVSDQVIVNDVVSTLDTYASIGNDESTTTDTTEANPYGEFGLPYNSYVTNTTLTDAEKAAIYALASEQNVKIKGLTENGHYIVQSPSGKLIEVTKDALVSENFYNEMYLDNTTGDFSLLVNDWILDQVADMDQIMKRKADFDQTPQQRIDEQLKDLANSLNSTPEEVKTVLDEKLKQLYEESDAGVRISNEVLKLILQSGFKNQHETGTSDGANNPAFRKAFEAYFMGLANIDNPDSPIYGNLFPSKDADLDAFARYAKGGPGHWYGSGNSSTTEVVAILDKEKTGYYTTITMGDSLDHARRNNLPADLKGYETIGDVQTPTAAMDPHFTGAAYGITKSIKSAQSIEGLKKIDLVELTKRGGGDEYIELQLYGQQNHGVDMIKELVFLTPPDQSVLTQLDSMSIPYTIVN